MSVNTNPQTVADLIGNVQAFKDVIVADQTAVNAAAQSLQDANTTLKSDQDGSAAAGAALGSALKQLNGGVAVQNADGTTTAFEPDGAGGYVPKVLQPATIPIPTS